MVYVGNDVVDLTNPRTEGRATDERFVGRVFDAEEQRALQAAGGSDVELWSRWAAKEAGYKAISKALGESPPFVHRAFEVQWTLASKALVHGASQETVVRRGTVRHGEQVASVVVTHRPGAVHAVAHWRDDDAAEPVRIEPSVGRLVSPGSCWEGTLEELLVRLTAREADAVRTLESAAVRLGARADVARLLGVAEERLEIVCSDGPATRRPPRVLLDGQAAPADVSLSHDGGWIAWAIWCANPTEIAS